MLIRRRLAPDPRPAGGRSTRGSRPRATLALLAAAARRPAATAARATPRPAARRPRRAARAAAAAAAGPRASPDLSARATSWHREAPRRGSAGRPRVARARPGLLARRRDPRHGRRGLGRSCSATSPPGRAVARLEGHRDAVTCLAFSPDGRPSPRAATTGRSGSGTRRPAASVATLAGHTNWVFALAFAPDGRTLASAGHDKTVRLWDVARPRATAVLDGPRRLGPGPGVRARRHGPRLGRRRPGRRRSGTSPDPARPRPAPGPPGDRSARSPSPRTGRRRSAHRRARTARSGSGTPARRGRERAARCSPGTPTWSSAWPSPPAGRRSPRAGSTRRSSSGTRRPAASGRPSRGTTTASASPPWPSPRGPGSSPRPASTAPSGSGSPPRRRSRRPPASPIPARPAAVAFAPDGRALLVAGGAGLARWDARTGSPPPSRPGRGRRRRPTPRALAVSPDGTDLRRRRPPTGSVRLLDAATAARARGRTPGPRGRGPSRSPSRRDGRLLASGGADGAVALWDVAARARRGTIDAGRARRPASGSRPTADRSPPRPTGGVSLWGAGGVLLAEVGARTAAGRVGRWRSRPTAGRSPRPGTTA